MTLKQPDGQCEPRRDALEFSLLQPLPARGGA